MDKYLDKNGLRYAVIGMDENPKQMSMSRVLLVGDEFTNKNYINFIQLSELKNGFTPEFSVTTTGSTNPEKCDCDAFASCSLCDITNPDPDSLNIVDYIENVYYSNGVTVVIWADGLKTVVRPSGGDSFDPEVGLAMAITQKLFGTRSQFVKYVAKRVKESDARKNKESKKKNV